MPRTEGERGSGERSLCLMTLQADYKPTTFHKQHCEALDPAWTVTSTPFKERWDFLDPDIVTRNDSWLKWINILFSWSVYERENASATRGQQRSSIITQLSWLEKVCHWASAPWWADRPKDTKYHRGGLRGSLVPIIRGLTNYYVTKVFYPVFLNLQIPPLFLWCLPPQTYQVQTQCRQHINSSQTWCWISVYIVELLCNTQMYPPAEAVVFPIKSLLLFLCGLLTRVTLNFHWICMRGRIRHYSFWPAHTHTFSSHIHMFYLIHTYILLSHTYILLSHTYIFTLAYTYILLSHTYIFLTHTYTFLSHTYIFTLTHIHSPFTHIHSPFKHIHSPFTHKHSPFTHMFFSFFM